jgi:hypothetical protein
VYGVCDRSCSIHTKQLIATAFLDQASTVRNKFESVFSIVKQNGISSMVLVAIDSASKLFHLGSIGSGSFYLTHGQSIDNSATWNERFMTFAFIEGQDNQFLILTSLECSLSDDDMSSAIDYDTSNLYLVANDIRKKALERGCGDIPVTVLKFDWVDKPVAPVSLVPSQQPVINLVNVGHVPSVPSSSLLDGNEGKLMIGLGIVAIAATVYGWLLSKSEPELEKSEEQKIEDLEQATDMSYKARVMRWWNKLPNSKKYLLGGGFVAAMTGGMYYKFH